MREGTLTLVKIALMLVTQSIELVAVNDATITSIALASDVLGVMTAVGLSVRGEALTVLHLNDGNGAGGGAGAGGGPKPTPPAAAGAVTQPWRDRKAA